MINNSDNDLEFEVGILCERANKEYHRSDTDFTNSLKRKLPDRVDILNEENENEFITKMKKEILKQISFEKSILSEYYSEEEIKTIINFKYNFILTKDTFMLGKIDVDDFNNFNSFVLPPQFDRNVNTIYNEFVSPTKKILEDRISNSSSTFNKAAISLLSKTLIRRNNQLFGVEDQDEDFGFNIRNYIVSLILMSSITVSQKLHLLYEIFDWEDGEGDGIDLKSIQLLSSTVMQRNLQFIPSYQINNMVELLFDGEASWISSWVYNSYNADKGNNISFENVIKGLNNINQSANISDNIEIESIDLTNEFQEYFWKYHRFFGCKSLNFHPKYSPFRDLQQVLKLSKSSKVLPKVKGNGYVLLIVYISNGVKRVFTSFYNESHQLIDVGDDDHIDNTEYKGIDKILKENRYICNIENYPKVVPKEIFISKLQSVPYYSDFFRSETTMKVRDLEDAIIENSDPLLTPLFIHLIDRNKKIMLTWEMTNATDHESDIGLTQKLKESEEISQFVGMRKGILIIRMSQAYKNSTLNDIEERIRSGIKIVLESIRTENQEIDELDFDEFAWGFFKSGSLELQLSKTAFLEDIIKNEGNELVYYSIVKRATIERNPENFIESMLEQFDSYCLLEEIGATNQWVPWKIHGKNKDMYIVELKNRIGYKILKQRKDLLLSKIQMHIYEMKLFEY